MKIYNNGKVYPSENDDDEMIEKRMKFENKSIFTPNEVCCMFPYTTFNNERNFIPFLQSQFVLMMNVETFNKQSKIFEVNICSFSRRLSTFSKLLLSHCRKDVQSMVE